MDEKVVNKYSCVLNYIEIKRICDELGVDIVITSPNGLKVERLPGYKKGLSFENLNDCLFYLKGRHDSHLFEVNKTEPKDETTIERCA